jgi:WD40 repeat protein
MGKSSLIVHVSEQLVSTGITVGQVDLTALGTSASPIEWYFGLLSLLAESLDVAEEADELWEANSGLGPAQRCFSTLAKAILGSISDSVVIFIDEIDATLGLPFSTDEFFGGIRYCYNRRAHDPDYARICFCLVGVASPADLIREPRLSPFNIGQRIELSDFTLEECAPLAQGLGSARGKTGGTTCATSCSSTRFPRVPVSPSLHVSSDVRLLERVFYWTNGHPYMTQRLCAAIADGITSPAGEPRTLSSRDVDILCKDLFFTSAARNIDSSLAFVRSRLLSGQEDVLEILDVYGRMLRGERIPYVDTSVACIELVLSGIARVANGSLVPRNRIFSQVFNRAWLRANLPDAEVRRQRRAYRQGALRSALISAVVVLVFAALAVANAYNARRARNAEAVAKSAAIMAQARTDYADHLVYDFSVSRAMQWYATDGLTMMEGQLNQSRPTGAEKDLHGFEWYYLRHVCHSYLREFPGQSGEVVAIAISPDGRSLASLSGNPSVTVWNLAGGQPIFTHLYPMSEGRPVSVAWSPDGRRLALGTHNGKVYVLDTASWREVQQFRTGTSPISSLAYSHRGALLITGSNDGRAGIRDARTLRELRHVTANVGRGIWAVAVSPDDKILATGGDDGVARLWDVATGRPLKALRGHSWYIYSLAFSPDGKTLATASGDATAVLWNVATGSHVAVLRGHTSYLYAVAYSPDGKTLATGAWDHTVRLWDAHTGALLRLIENTNKVWALAYCLNGSALAVGCSDSTVRLWSVENSQLYREVSAGTERVLTISYSADGAQFVTSGDDGIARIWDAHTGALLQTLPHQPSLLGACLIGDHCRLVSRFGGVTDIDLKSKTLSIALRPYAGSTCVAMQADGSLVVKMISPTQAAVQRVGEPSPPVPLAGYSEYKGYTFNASGSLVAFQTQTGYMEICDTHTGHIVAQSDSRLPDLTMPLAFSHDSRLLTAGDRNRHIYIWNARTGHLVNTIFSGVIYLNTAAFTADDRRFATGALDGSLTLWDTATWHAALTVANQGAPVSCVTVSPDGQQIVTGDRKGKIRIWDAPRE